MMAIHSSSSPIRVLIADDCPRVRSALRFFIENEAANCKVIGEVEDLRALQACANHKAVDLVLLDWELPGLPDTQEKVANCISQLHQTRQRLVVVAFSGYTESREEACEAGADGFISKIDPPEELIAMLRKVVRGEKSEVR